MADKVANSEEKSVDAFDSGSSYYEPAEKSASQERVEEQNRGFFYFNDHHLNGYTGNGDLFESWIGRQGQQAQAGTNYWFGARNPLQFNFRDQKDSQRYISGGSTLTDAGARGDYWVRSNRGLSASAQCGRWLFPVIQPNAQRNVTATVEILFHSRKLFHRSITNATGSASGNGGRP